MSEHGLLRAITVEGIAITALVARDGRPGWTVMRVALVAAAATSAARWRWVALAFGVVGSVLGIAVAGPHLVKDGVSPTALAAVVAFLAAAVVTATTTRALAGGSWRRRAAGVAVGLVVAQLVVLPLLGAFAATNVPPTRLGDRTPADAGLAYDDVRLRTDDGVTLRAWYVASRNGAAVVLLHGSGSTRTSVLDHGIALAGAGYGVLLLDGRGHGESGGDAMDFGWYGESDVGAAVGWLAERPDVVDGRIGAVGLSMGGEQALTVAADDERIRAVVAEGATQRVPADGGWRSLGGTGAIRWLDDRITYGVADLLSSARPPIGLRTAVRRLAPRPVLLIAGAPADEIPAGRWLRAAAPTTTDLWELPDTPHTDGLDRHHDEWVARVTAVLRAM